MTNEKAVAEKLLQIEAVKLAAHEPFTWASGWKSPIYCDNRKILSFPFIRDFIKSELCNLLFEEFADAEYLAGVATAGIAWGALAADQLKLPFVYVRSKAKEHGLGNMIEGEVESGKRVVVVEDLISTGMSSMAVVRALQEAGMEVIGLVSIFNYGFDKAAAIFTESNIPVKSLTNYGTLVQLAVEKQMIPASVHEVLLQWREDPANWQGIPA